MKAYLCRLAINERLAVKIFSLALLLAPLLESSWALACGAYPTGVASTDRVLSFLPSSGVFEDKPLSLASSSAEGMVVFDSSDGSVKYCDGTSWKSLTKATTPALLATWGLNSNRQLANAESNAEQSSPVRPSTVDFSTTSWKTLALGNSHTCAIRSSDDRIFCWGDGGTGQLGTGATRPVGSPVSLASTGAWETTAWRSVSAMGNFTCAIRLSDDRIFCWGDATYGQLGAGNTTQSTSPTSLDSVGGWDTTAWATVSAGKNHTCAIRSSDNRMFCWGDGSTGQLGTGALSAVSTPTALTATGGWDTTAWKSVSAGEAHTCAIRSSDDRIFCWGEGANGRLGTGATAVSSSPVSLSSTGGWDTTTWKSVAAGRAHTCAIRSSDNRIFCWGDGGNGRLGTGATTMSSVPAALDSAGGWDATAWKTVAVNFAHTCAIRSSDNVAYCWGANATGQLGNGTTTDKSSPTSLNVTGSWSTTAWKAVLNGNGHTCGIRNSDSQIICWGQGANGRLGTGLISDQYSPVSLRATSGWGTSTWKVVGAGNAGTCGIRASDDRLFCWGLGGSGQNGSGNSTDQPAPISLDASGGFDTTAWKTVSVGYAHACALRSSDSRMYCWGNGTFGRMGNGTTSGGPTPQALTATNGWDATAWKYLSAGFQHTCAIRASDDRLFCWGQWLNGRLGTGGTAAVSVPTALSSTGGWDTTAWKAIATGQLHTCAIRSSDSRIFCWGGASSGQLGTGNTTEQTTPAALDSVNGFDTTAWKALAVGLNHTCAIRDSDSRLFCWGLGTNGRLGTGDTSNQLSPPALSSTGGFNTTAWKTVSAGESETCAIRASDERLFCWGNGANGRIGNGSTSDQSTPTALNSVGGWNTTSWQAVSVGGSHVVAIESSANYPLSTSAPAGVGLNDLALKFTTFSSNLVNGSSSWLSALGGSAWSTGILAYDTSSNILKASDGTHWIPLSATSSGTSCLLTYPDASSTRVIEFAADGSNRTYNSTRAKRTTPRLGSFIYNPSLKALQYCDGTSWQTLLAP